MTGLPVFAAAYGAVLLAEIAGDKLMYTSGVLATRYRRLPVLCGMVVAFMAKMAVAVAIGDAISRLPTVLLCAITAIGFGSLSCALLREPAACSPERTPDTSATRGALLSFMAIFLSEWGDVGQITAAVFSARYGAPLLVWFAAVSAMITKGAIAVSVGAGLRKWVLHRVAPQTLRYGSALLIVVLGLASLAELLGMDI